MIRHCFPIRILSWGVLCFAVAAAPLAGKAPSGDQPTSQVRPSNGKPFESAAQKGPAGEIDSSTPKEVAPRPGEICLMCDEPIGKNDVVYVVNGQRIPVHRGACDSKYAANPQVVLAQLQPHGAFLGTGPVGRGLSSVWFVVGLFILIGLVFGALSAHHAFHAGHNPLAWFVAGLAFNILGFLALVLRPKREVAAPAGVPRGLRKIPATYAPVKCPACGNLHHPAAKACPACGTPLTPPVASEVDRIASRRM